MRHLPLLLLSPLLLVLLWLFWVYPKGGLGNRWRLLYNLVVTLLTVMACAWATTSFHAASSSPAAGVFGRQSGDIWNQVKPSLCGYGISIGVLGIAVAIRSILWRSRAVR
ncbi:hypothetical protein ISP15_01505 [Dyella jejuensis]|uniref:Uncharacterized protein n=1 Tax=Dyella jejuensis TaxID=1432009 RepID=A0ABW8JD51_9GAMM